MTTEQHTAAADVSIAYFITSYGASNQLLRLVTTLRSAAPDAPIVIHHDVFRSPPDPALQDIPNVHLLTSDHPIVWGDMTLEAARWRVFRWILTHLRVDWVVLLSEQDYPIAPLRDLPARLADADVDAVILGERIDQITDPQLHRECELRYLYRYVSLPPVRIRRGLPASWRRSLGRFRGLFYTAVTRSQRKLFIYTTPDALELPSRIGLRQGSTPFSEEFPCWYNDCWYALSRKALRAGRRLCRHSPRLRPVLPAHGHSPRIRDRDDRFQRSASCGWRIKGCMPSGGATRLPAARTSSDCRTWSFFVTRRPHSRASSGRATPISWTSSTGSCSAIPRQCRRRHCPDQRRPRRWRPGG